MQALSSCRITTSFGTMVMEGAAVGIVAGPTAMEGVALRIAGPLSVMSVPIAKQALIESRLSKA